MDNTMYSNEINETIDTPFKIKKLLWIGLTAGLILYMLAVYFITAGKEPNYNMSATTEYLFAAVGVILFITAIIFRRFSFSNNNLKNIFLQQGNTAATDELHSEDTATKIKKYLSRQQVFYIISLAINDSIGILGIAIGFISSDLSKALPYIACALLLNIWVYPRKERFINNIQSYVQY